MKKTNYYFMLSAIIIIIFLSCAQPVSPTGGDKDETPPVIIRTSPLINSLNTAPKIIHFYFNENVQISSPENNIIISPTPLIKPKYVRNNTSLEIHFQPLSFIESTTYSINLGASISDLNEGNKLISTPFLFSTGAVLDTATIVGTIEQSVGKLPSKLKVICTDSGTEQPEYIGQVLENVFLLSGLNSKPKTIIAYNDENNNNQVDSIEDIGFVTGINSTKKDSIIVKLYSSKKPIINQYSNAYFDYLTGIPEQFVEEIAKLNQQVYYIGDTLFGRATIITELLNTNIPNTYIVSKTKNSLKAYTSYTIEQKSTSSFHTISIAFNMPILTIDTLQFLYVFQGDTSQLKGISVSYNRNILNIGMPSNTIPDQIIIPKGSMQLTDNTLKPEFNVTLRLNLTCNLTFDNKSNRHLTGTVYSTNVIKSLNIAPKSSTTVNVPQGTYESLLFEDTNKDHLINGPVPKTKTPGEYWIKNKNIIANPKLDNVITLN